MRFGYTLSLIMIISFCAAFAFGKGIEAKTTLGANEADEEKILIQSTCNRYIAQIAEIMGVEVDGPPIAKLPKIDKEDHKMIMNVYSRWVRELDTVEGGPLYTRYRIEMQKLYRGYEDNEQPVTRAGAVMKSAGCKMIPVKQLPV